MEEIRRNFALSVDIRAIKGSHKGESAALSDTKDSKHKTKIKRLSILFRLDFVTNQNKIKLIPVSIPIQFAMYTFLKFRHRNLFYPIDFRNGNDYKFQ